MEWPEGHEWVDDTNFPIQKEAIYRVHTTPDIDLFLKGIYVGTW